MWLYHRVVSPNDADGLANSVDPDQTAPVGAVSDLGLHCLLRPIRPKIQDHIRQSPAFLLVTHSVFNLISTQFTKLS